LLGNTGSSQTSGNNGCSILPLPANLAARMTPNTMSSYASAVTVYSAKMGNLYPPLKHRPISAANQTAPGRSASLFLGMMMMMTISTAP